MNATLSSSGFSSAFTFSGFSLGSDETISTVFSGNSTELPLAKSDKTFAIVSNIAYDQLKTIIMPRFTFGAIEKMPIPTSSPLTVGWAVGLTSALIVSALAIAGGTLAILHSDINDVRSEVSAVRDGAASDNQNLRSDMRQDSSQINQKLDKMTTMLSDMRVEQAKGRNQP